MKNINTLTAFLSLAATSLIPSAHAQQWTGNMGNQWNNTNNWSPNTVPNGRDVTVVVANNATIPVISNTGQGFTHLQVGNNAGVNINISPGPNPIILAPEDPFNPGNPSFSDPSTITIGTNSTLIMTYLSNPASGPMGPEPFLLDVSVGTFSEFQLTGLGQLAGTMITKSGEGRLSLGNGGYGSILVTEGILRTSNGMFATSSIGSIQVESGATLTGTGATASGGLVISIEENGNFLEEGFVLNYIAPDAEVTLAGLLNFRLDALKDDNDGIKGVDWSRVDLSNGSIFFADEAFLTINFLPTHSPDGGDPFWNSDHTWQLIDADSYTGTLKILNPTYAAGSFSFDSSNGQLSFSAIPEPSAALLVFLGAGGWLLKKRRRDTITDFSKQNEAP